MSHDGPQVNIVLWEIWGLRSIVESVAAARVDNGSEPGEVTPNVGRFARDSSAYAVAAILSRDVGCLNAIATSIIFPKPECARCPASWTTDSIPDRKSTRL